VNSAAPNQENEPRKGLLRRVVVRLGWPLSLLLAMGLFVWDIAPRCARICEDMGNGLFIPRPYAALLELCAWVRRLWFVAVPAALGLLVLSWRIPEKRYWTLIAVLTLFATAVIGTAAYILWFCRPILVRGMILPK